MGGKTIAVGIRDLHSVDDSGDITQNRQTDVNEQVGAASSLEKHSQRGEENGEDELANITKNEKSQSSSILMVVNFSVKKS